MDKLKKIWKIINENLIISGIIVLLIGTWLLRFIDNHFSLNIFSSIFGFARQEWIVPMWGLILIGAVPVGMIISGGKLTSFLKKKSSPSAATEPDWKYYREDTLFSILCQWRYLSNGKIITDNLLLLCPKCKRELKMEREISGYGVTHYFMKCPNCGFRSNRTESSIYDFKNKIISEIEGRIRNKEYKEKSNTSCVPKNFNKKLVKEKREPRW